MSKPLVVVSCPIDTFSGYGARSRDVVKALFKTGKYDIKVLPQRWGSTPYGVLDANNPEDKQILDNYYPAPQLQSQPDIWIQITVPNVKRYVLEVVGVNSLVGLQDGPVPIPQQNGLLKACGKNVKETHDFTQILPEKYYEPGSHLLNRQVAFALKHTDSRLFISWVALRAKASDFDYDTIPDLYNKWNKDFHHRPDGVTKKSIIYWAKQDAFEEYEKINKDCIKLPSPIPLGKKD